MSLDFSLFHSRAVALGLFSHTPFYLGFLFLLSPFPLLFFFYLFLFLDFYTFLFTFFQLLGIKQVLMTCLT